MTFDAFAARPGGAPLRPEGDTPLAVATTGPEVEIERLEPAALVFAAVAAPPAAPLAGAGLARGGSPFEDGRCALAATRSDAELLSDELSEIIALEDDAPAGAAASDGSNALRDAAALVPCIAGAVEAATSPKLPGRVALPPISSTPRASSVVTPWVSSAAAV